MQDSAGLGESEVLIGILRNSPDATITTRITSDVHSMAREHYFVLFIGVSVSTP